MYVRAVSRHDGMRSSSEHSFVRDWLLHQRDVMPRQAETVYVGHRRDADRGAAGASSRQATAAAARRRRRWRCSRRTYEKQKHAVEEAKRKARRASSIRCCFRSRNISSSTCRRTDDDARRSSGRWRCRRGNTTSTSRSSIARGSRRRAPAVLQRTMTIPDFWSDELALSSLILAKDVRPLKTAFAGAAAGRASVHVRSGRGRSRARRRRSRTDEALTVVFQMCNYGAPDSDLAAHYTFYRVDGDAAAVQPHRAAAVRRRRSAAGRRVGIAGVHVADRAAAAVSAGAVRARSRGPRSPDAGDGESDRGIHGRVWVKIGVRPVGAWLSLVEHSVRDRGVGGSNPLAPTNKFSIEYGPRLTVMVGRGPFLLVVFVLSPRVWTGRKNPPGTGFASTSS